MPRPPLGVLRLSTGDVVTLDRSVLLGRAPKLGDGLAAHDRPHVVKVPSPERDVSRNHVEVILEGWHVLIRDLGTTNGTTVTLPGESPVRLRANDQQVLEPGSVVSMADEVSFTFEARPRPGSEPPPRRARPRRSRAWSSSSRSAPAATPTSSSTSSRAPRMPVAVKVLKSEGLTDALRQQFVEEADTMAALGDHPYIVQVFRSGTSDDGRPYLVMKYYPPPNLAMRARGRALLRRGGAAHRHPARQRRRDRAPGPHHAPRHQAGQRPRQRLRRPGPDRLRHRRPRRARRADARPAARPPTTSASRSRGRPRRSSTARATATSASDVYSLAATLWQLLVGRSPFEVPGGDNSAYALMPRIRSTAPPATGRQDVPAGLERLLAQAMAKDPAHRPASALELARALQAVEQQQRLGRTPDRRARRAGPHDPGQPDAGLPDGPRRGRRGPHPHQGPADRRRAAGRPVADDGRRRDPSSLGGRRSALVTGPDAQPEPCDLGGHPCVPLPPPTR